MSIGGGTATLHNRVLADGGVVDIAMTEAERRHIAGLLTSVEREAHVSQRKLALELGVALGLVNTYIKRCVKKGLIKVQQAPSRQYRYYLTARGLAEKSRLTAEYLSWSLSFFRRARADCAAILGEARRKGWRQVGFVGGSDLAEIAIISAAEQDVAVAGLVDGGMTRASVMGVPVFVARDAVNPRPDGWIVTAIGGAQGVYDMLVAAEGAGHVLAPALLSLRLAKDEGT